MRSACRVLCALVVVGVDVGHVDFCKVLAGCGDDGVDIDVMLMGREDCIQGGGLCLFASQIAAPWV